MTRQGSNIKTIYEGAVAKHYDFPISHMFGKYKKLAFNDSSLTRGDRVLVFCCGTGLDFPYILRRIGTEGEIVGVDLSAEMLGRAKARIRRHQWENIELVEADVTEFRYAVGRQFDAGVCTLGISIIPDYMAAYAALLSHVKEQGEIIIGDMQLASGWLARFNPITIFLARKFGGSLEGHKNSRELRSRMERELADVKKRGFFFESYYYCIGKKK